MSHRVIRVQFVTRRLQDRCLLKTPSVKPIYLDVSLGFSHLEGGLTLRALGIPRVCSSLCHHPGGPNMSNQHLLEALGLLSRSGLWRQALKSS